MILKREKCIIVGKSGSGKDFIMRKLVERGLTPSLKWTTRPARKREIQGITYNFVTESSFQSSIENNEFLFWESFNVTPNGKDSETWFYGTTNEEFEKASVFIMTPKELTSLSPEQRKECFVVYLDIDRSVRESRLLKRKDNNDSIMRRLDADEKDFTGFNDFDLKIRDPEFTVEDIFSLMD